MPFHVRITPKSDKTHDEIKLDLSRENTRTKNSWSPMMKVVPIVIGGKNNTSG